MSDFSKYLFDTDFTDPNTVRAQKRVEEVPEIEVPVFSEDDVVAAREHGYEAGIAAGKAQATVSIEQRIEDLLSNTTEQFHALNTIVENRQFLVSQDVATLSGAIASKVIGKQTDEQRVDLISSLVQGCISKLYQVPEITMQVANDLTDDLRTRFAASDLTIAVTIVGEPGLSGSDFRLLWNGGGGERIEAEIWREVEGILERHLDATAPTEAKQDETPSDAQTESVPAEGMAAEDVAAEDAPLDDMTPDLSGETQESEIEQSNPGADDQTPRQE